MCVGLFSLCKHDMWAILGSFQLTPCRNRYSPKLIELCQWTPYIYMVFSFRSFFMFRWRLKLTLIYRQQYAKSRVHLEGSKAQCYSTEEVVGWCLDYMDPTNRISISKVLPWGKAIRQRVCWREANYSKERCLQMSPLSSVAAHSRGGTLHRIAYGDVEATKHALGWSLVSEGTYEWVQHLVQRLTCQFNLLHRRKASKAGKGPFLHSHNLSRLWHRWLHLLHNWLRQEERVPE
jgi:hypothetical protein